MRFNIYNALMRKAYLFGVPVLHSGMPIPREDVPQGWYCYDLRGTDRTPHDPCSVVDHADKYHTGSVLSLLPLKSAGTQSRPLEDEFRLTQEFVSLKTFSAENGVTSPEIPFRYQLRPASSAQAPYPSLPPLAKARSFRCVSSPHRTRFTPTEVCTLISHETVSMLDTVQTEIPQCVRECRTALEALTTAHNLGEDGETLLNWLDTEIANAELFATDGVNLPYLIDMTCLNPEPDAAAQMDLIWALFETAAMEKCRPEQRQALLSTARTVTEMCGMEDLLLAAPRPNAAKLAKGLSAELDDIRCALKVNAKLYPSSVRQELG